MRQILYTGLSTISGYLNILKYANFILEKAFTYKFLF